MVLTGVGLFLQPAHCGPVLPHYDEQVLRVEAVRFIAVDDLNVREPLAIRADFVLAFDD
jgi:hypothetical protein